MHEATSKVWCCPQVATAVVEPYNTVFMDQNCLVAFAGLLSLVCVGGDLGCGLGMSFPNYFQVVRAFFA